MDSSLLRRLTIPILCGLVFVLIVILSLLNIHGFSVPQWHDTIDGSPQTEVIAGQARGIRSDDFVAVIPQILSQCAHRPAFPAFNTLIGDGQCNMRLNYALPIADWTLLFRPQMWGYFAGTDFGLAWNWWVMALGVWLALVVLIRIVTQGQTGIALGGATILVCSPFFQYWSLNCAPSVMFAALSLIFADQLYRGQHPISLVFRCLGLVWALTAFVFTFSFLPYLVSLSYVIGFCFVGLRLAGLPSSSQSRFLPTGLLVIAVLFVALAIIFFIRQNAESIRIAVGSAYPGNRFSPGGEETWVDLFRGSFLTWTHPFKWHALGNICGAASFCLFFPVTLGIAIFYWRRQQIRPDGLQIALWGCLVVLLAWYLVGLPDFMARFSGLHRVPARRALLAIGLCDVLLLCSVLRQHNKSRFAQLLREPILWMILGGFVLLLMVEGYFLQTLLPSYGRLKILLAGSITLLLGFLLVFLPRGFLPALALASICSTMTFNPLVRGGTAYIRGNPLSQAITSIHEKALKDGTQTCWVAYGYQRYDIHLPNLFRMLGVRSLDGVHPYPQPGVWLQLDPRREFETIWNRYAHVRYELPADPDVFSIDLLQHDLLVVRVHPQNPRLAALGLTHILVKGDPVPFQTIQGLKHVWSGGHNSIFQVVPVNGISIPK